MSLSPSRLPETLAAYRAAGIAGDDETVLWHIVRDIIEFCDAQDINLEALTKDARNFDLEDSDAR